ncbi:unnamed protein product, partial [Ilex paraguariensis]
MKNLLEKNKNSASKRPCEETILELKRIPADDDDQSHRRRQLGSYDEDDQLSSSEVSKRVVLSDPVEVDDLGDVGNEINNFSRVDAVETQGVSAMAPLLLLVSAMKPIRSWKRRAKKNVVGTLGTTGEYMVTLGTSKPSRVTLILLGEFSAKFDFPRNMHICYPNVDNRYDIVVPRKTCFFFVAFENGLK